MRYSIIIPTITYDLVVRCLDSVIYYTDLNDVEIIVVTNGISIDDIKKLESYPIKLVSFDKPLGAVRAYNEGVKVASGEYIILLNDDTVILNSEKNSWINILNEPFLYNTKMAITGPLIGRGTFGFENEEFIIFFCAMIPRKMFDEFGLFDEKLLCGIDFDFCHIIKKHGYEIKRVPEQEGTFPIWHEAEKTVHTHYGVEGWGKIMKEDESILKEKHTIKNKTKKVLCSISTKNRYESLAQTVLSIAMQTKTPDKLIIFDDGAHEDLRQKDYWNNLFHLLDKKNISWEVIFSDGKGQHHNHQRANRMDFDYVWRIDDDEVAEPNVLELLLAYMSDDVGAVGGSVIDPTYNSDIEGSPKLEDIFHMPNIQWTSGTKIVEVEHLYSSFLYRSNIVDYPTVLSPVAHREETIFSHRLFRKGYKLLVNQRATTWHLRAKTGGIRENTNESMWQWDEKMFSDILENEWGIKVVSLGVGLGDHLAFINILPELIKKHKKIIIGNCYPDIFNGYDVKLVPFGPTKDLDTNIYKWMWDNNWKKSIVEAFSTIYFIPFIEKNNPKFEIPKNPNNTVVISPYSRVLRNGKENPKNYPYWLELIEKLENRGANIIQIGTPGEFQLVKDFRSNLKLTEIVDLLKGSDVWISVDNFLPHLAHLHGVRGGIVLWGKSDPRIFGYPENVNIWKGEEFLRKKQFDIWETEEFDKDVFIKPSGIV